MWKIRKSDILMRLVLVVLLFLKKSAEIFLGSYLSHRKGLLLTPKFVLLEGRKQRKGLLMKCSGCSNWWTWIRLFKRGNTKAALSRPWRLQQDAIIFLSKSLHRVPPPFSCKCIRCPDGWAIFFWECGVTNFLLWDYSPFKLPIANQFLQCNLMKPFVSN